MLLDHSVDCIAPSFPSPSRLHASRLVWITLSFGSPRRLDRPPVGLLSSCVFFISAAVCLPIAVSAALRVRSCECLPMCVFEMSAAALRARCMSTAVTAPCVHRSVYLPLCMSPDVYVSRFVSAAVCPS